MDIASITATVTGLKTAGDIVNGLLSAKTSSAINTAVAELNSHLLSVQREAMAANAEQLAMVEEIRTLKEEITEMKVWGSEKERYKLATIGDTGVVTYALQETMSNSEPPHYLCTNCYNEGKKSILNPRKMKNSRIMFVCGKCGNESHTMYSHIEPEYYQNG